MPEQQVSSGTGNDAAPAATDRRGAERYACDLQPSWRVLGQPSGESWGAHVRDISRTGISLRMRCWMKPGTVLVIRLHGRSEGLSRPVPLRVMHSTAAGDGEWLIGGMFVRPLRDEELRQLVNWI
jgi:hypothetical protein